jgi:Protein of unknown function (DUF2384)
MVCQGHLTNWHTIPQEWCVLFYSSTVLRTSSMSDFDFVKKSANKAGEILCLNQWFDDLDFLRIYKYLHISVGGDEQLMNHWMHTQNRILEGVPANLITTEKGIREVLDELRYNVYR